jgi:hypothetical protein
MAWVGKIEAAKERLQGWVNFADGDEQRAISGRLVRFVRRVGMLGR